MTHASNSPTTDLPTLVARLRDLKSARVRLTEAEVDHPDGMHYRERRDLLRAVDDILALCDALTSLAPPPEAETPRHRRACECQVPDPVMQSDRKFYCYRCSFETGARPESSDHRPSEVQAATLDGVKPLDTASRQPSGDEPGRTSQPAPAVRELVARLRALAEKASPEPWQAYTWTAVNRAELESDVLTALRLVPDPKGAEQYSGVFIERDGRNFHTALTGNGPTSQANAEFIVALVNAFPVLCDALADLGAPRTIDEALAVARTWELTPAERAEISDEPKPSHATQEPAKTCAKCRFWTPVGYGLAMVCSAHGPIYRRATISTFGCTLHEPRGAADALDALGATPEPSKTETPLVNAANVIEHFGQCPICGGSGNVLGGKDNTAMYSTCTCCHGTGVVLTSREIRAPREPQP